MATKKQIAASPEAIARVELFLAEGGAGEDVLASWKEIKGKNEEMQRVLEEKSRLRDLYLKAIRKTASSERITGKAKDPAKPKTPADLRKAARREAEKAWLHRQRCRFMKQAARDVEKSGSQGIEAEVKSEPPVHPEGVGAQPGENMSESTSESEQVKPGEETAGQLLAQMANDEILRRHKKGEFDPYETGFPEDFKSLIDEARAIGDIVDKKDGDVRRLREEMLNDSAAKGGNGFRLFPCATLFASRPGLVTSKDEILSVDKKESRTGFRQSFEESTRWNISLRVEEIKVRREVLYNPETDERKVAAQTLGPRGFQLTWGAMTNIVILAVEYLMPLHRISALLSTPDKSFSRSHLWDILCYVAECSVDPWLEMASNLAVHGYRWFGDDAATRTRRMLPSTAKQEKKKSLRPRHFDEKVLARIHKVLRREAPKRDGEPKKGAFTTVVAGRTYDMDETTWVVLYYTHFGSFGDVVEDLLRTRREERAKRFVELQKEAKAKGEPVPTTISERFDTIDITCDASSANHPKHDYGFVLRYFGCAMHARRKFMEIPEEDRSEEVNRIIHYFSFLYAMEEWLAKTGRTPKRVGRMRYRWGTWVWETICYEAELILKKENASSAERKAANYIVENFETLQAYLDCLFSAPDNGISERYLRPIRLAENTTHGLETERGRLVKDILRSMIATCRAIGVPFEEYLPWLLAECDVPADQRKRPGQLTPHSFLQVWKSRPAGSQPKG